MRAILVTGLEVDSAHLTYVIATGTGENLVGMKAAESSGTVTLRQARGGELVLPRANIRSIQSQVWSLMPERLAEGLEAQGMADLLEFILLGK